MYATSHKNALKTIGCQKGVKRVSNGCQRGDQMVSKRAVFWTKIFLTPKALGIVSLFLFLHFAGDPQMPLWSYRPRGSTDAQVGDFLRYSGTSASLGQSCQENGHAHSLDPFQTVHFALAKARAGPIETFNRFWLNECKVSVAIIELLRFVKRAARPRKPQPDFEIEPATFSR